MNNSLSPKVDFISDKKLADVFMEMVMSPQFRAGAEIAIAEYSMRLNGNDPRGIYRLAGARDVIDVLLNLGNADYELKQENDFPPLKVT